MAVDDLWYLRQRDLKTKKKLPSKRYGRGKRWRVRYNDDAGRERQRLFDRKPDAERFDASVRSDVDRGLYIDPAAGKVLVRDYCEKWRKSQLHRDSTAESVENSFRRHLYPVLGNLALAQVRSSHIQAWVKGVDLAPSTVRVLYAHATSMFRAAVNDRAIAQTPCVGITLPEVSGGDHLILTPKQVHELAAELPARYQAAVYVGAGCGLRQGEMLGLELQHVNFLRREITVVQQLKTLTGRKPFLAAPKTKTSRRVVELPEVTAEALAEHLVKYPPVEIEIEDETDTRKKRARNAKLLFPNDSGLPTRRASWSRIWANSAKEIGLPPRSGFHLLRHYFATLLIFNGANVKTVQLALGHSVATITLNTYVGLWPDQVERTRKLVDQALSPESLVPAPHQTDETGSKLSI